MISQQRLPEILLDVVGWLDFWFAVDIDAGLTVFPDFASTRDGVSRHPARTATNSQMIEKLPTLILLRREDSKCEYLDALKLSSRQ